jgi:hypothetical protein
MSGTWISGVFLFPVEEKKKRRFIFEYLVDRFTSGFRDGSVAGGIGDNGN